MHRAKRGKSFTPRGRGRDRGRAPAKTQLPKVIQPADEGSEEAPQDKANVSMASYFAREVEASQGTSSEGESDNDGGGDKAKDVETESSDEENNPDDQSSTEGQTEKHMWEDFHRQIKKDREKAARRRALLTNKVKEYQKRSANPVRAELFSTLRMRTKTMTSLLSVLKDLKIPDVEDFVKPKSGLTSAENLQYYVVRVVDYITANYEHDAIFSFLCDVNVKECYEKRESLQWSGYELKRTVDEPVHEFHERPDLTPLPKEELETIRRTIRQNARRMLHPDDSCELFMRTSTKDRFILLSVMEVKTRHGKKVNITSKSFVVAYDPNIPYVCYHGKQPAEDILKNVIECLPGDFAFARNLHLNDIGLNSVYTSMIKVSSLYVAISPTTMEKVKAEELLEKEQGVAEIEGLSFSTKRRRLLKHVIDDQQEGGFKSLTLEFKKSNRPPVTFKVSTKKGNLDAFVADMYERNLWTDPTPYLLARDRKTNHLKLKAKEGYDNKFEVDEENVGLSDAEADSANFSS